MRRRREDPAAPAACPFCGSSGIDVSLEEALTSNGTTVAMRCDTCGSQGPVVLGPMNGNTTPAQQREALRLWNGVRVAPRGVLVRVLFDCNQYTDASLPAPSRTFEMTAVYEKDPTVRQRAFSGGWLKLAFRDTRLARRLRIGRKYFIDVVEAPR